MIASILKSIMKNDPLQLLGCVFLGMIVIHHILPFFSALWRLFLRPAKKPTSFGQWAVVTGATDGIGKAYAFRLAAKGMNVLLVSRTASKLSAVQSEISAKHPAVQIRTVQIDFGSFDTAAQFQLKKSIEGLNVGVLINNVGQSYDHPEFFHSLDSTTVQSLIDLNIKSTTIVTHIVLPTMLEQKRGAIINISSFAGLVVSPLLSEYSAAKAYVDKLSLGLHEEYKGRGISIQTQNALFVSTKLAKIKSASLTVPSPDSYASAGLRCLGYEAQVVPFWAHALQVAIVKLLPQSIVTAYATKLHLSLRKRALKKKESQQKSQ